MQKQNSRQVRDIEKFTAGEARDWMVWEGRGAG